MTTNRYKFVDEKGEHVHLLDNQPLIGTSRIGNVLAKPLAWYGSGKAVEVFGCPNPKVLTKIKNKKATEEEVKLHKDCLSASLRAIKLMEEDQFGKLIDKAYRAHDVYKRERAVIGTDIHAECEKVILDRMRGDALDHEYPKEVWPFIEWAEKYVKRFLWAEGHCYSEKHWLGGISDAGYETQDGKFGILDFKSTKEAYVSQFWQEAGYDIQVGENGVLDENGNLLYTLESPITEYCIFAFGGDKPQPYFFSDPKGAKEAFLACLLIYNKLPKE